MKLEMKMGLIVCIISLTMLFMLILATKLKAFYQEMVRFEK